jgi:hypothetical protein
VDPRELDKRREAAQRDAAGVKPAAPRIRLLNTPPHRNLDGELGDEDHVDMKPDRIQPRTFGGEPAPLALRPDSRSTATPPNAEP